MWNKWHQSLYDVSTSEQYRGGFSVCSSMKVRNSRVWEGKKLFCLYADEIICDHANIKLEHGLVNWKKIQPQAGNSNVSTQLKNGFFVFLHRNVSLLIYKEMCSSKSGEFMIRSWELQRGIRSFSAIIHFSKWWHLEKLCVVKGVKVLKELGCCIGRRV